MSDETLDSPADESEQTARLSEKTGAIGFLVSIFFLNMLSRLGLAPILPALENDLGISHSEAGSFFLFVSVWYGVGLFSSSFLSSKILHHRLIIISSLGLGAALVLASLSPGVWGLRTVLCLLGLTSGFYLPSGVASITALVRKEDWGKALGIHQLAPNLAYLVAPFTANLIMLYFSWRTVLLVYGLVAIVDGLIFIPYKGIGRFTGAPPNLDMLGRLIKNRAIWIMIALFSLSIGVNQGIFAMMPLYLFQERGFSVNWANNLISISRVAAFGAPLVVGWLADRHGLKMVLYGVILMSSLATLLLPFIPGNLIALGLILQAVASVCFFPLGFSALSNLTTPENRNVAVAVTIPFGHFLGAGLVPVAIGWFGDTVSFNYAFLLLGGLTIAALFIIKYLVIPEG